MDSNRQERRRFRRAACEADASYRPVPGNGPRNYETQLNDISEGGIRFRTTEFMGINEKVLLKIKLPEGPAIETMAQPAWTRELTTISRHEIGLRFLSLTEEDRRSIKNFVGISLALERLRTLNPTRAAGR